tara:strand:+ start:342 stop:1397 length:1056 start_codon:yes stop_codon:yes gene_type:complete
MEQLSLGDFDNLCDEILNGEKSIQDQFDVYNNRRDILNKMSFLNHLLSYKNIHKDNLLEILYKIYLMFQKRIHDLSSNDTIQKMIQRNNSEWYVDGLEFSIKDPIYNDFFNHHIECQGKYDKCCVLCDEVDELVKNEHNIPLESELHNSHPLEKHFDSGIMSCEESINYIQEIINDIDSKIISYFNNFDLYQLIDLSIKHKSLYLILVDKEDDLIPENIHKIFSNFLYVHNLFYKQIIQYFNYLKNILNDLQNRCQKIKNFKQNVQTVAYVDQEKLDNQDDPKNNFFSDSDSDHEDIHQNEVDLDSGDEEEFSNQFTVKDGKIQIKNDDDDDDNDNDEQDIIDQILKKLLG